MKAALIPPVAHLQDFCWDDRFHLVLSHLLDNPTYLGFYREQRLMGSYLILDNGAHENVAGEEMATLLVKAQKIRANEVVLPDALADWEGTVQRTTDALGYLLGPGQDAWDGMYPEFMVVPQGATRWEWNTCLQELIVAYTHAMTAGPDLFRRHLVVGVSKDYDAWEGGHMSLIAHLGRLRSIGLQFDVHLLGWARYLPILSDIATSFPWVRSTDSAKPFVYAINGIELFRDEAPEYPRRTASYFDVVLGVGTSRLAQRNVRVFKEAAQGG